MKHISEYNVRCETRELNVNGHILSIENEFALTPNIILIAINELLKKDYRIEKFEDIVPESLFKKNFKERNSDFDKELNLSDNNIPFDI